VNPAPSIFGQGETWKAYEENMPSNCSPADSGEYAVRHNPPPYYTSLTDCSTFDVPYTQLAGDLSNGTLPAFSFVTPNLIDDMHDGTIADGDTWLSNNLPVIFNSLEYQSGSTAVFVTWDEGEGGTSDNCAQNTTDIGCHVATLVVSPSTVPGHHVGDVVQPLLIAEDGGGPVGPARTGPGRVEREHGLGVQPVGTLSLGAPERPFGAAPVEPTKCRWERWQCRWRCL
jgi:hypothetical protein